MRAREGDWFAVPLAAGGFALGLCARAKGTAMLGYFFGPRRPQPPHLADADGLAAADAICVQLCSDLGLRRGTWPLLGRLPSWDRNAWPMPVFGRLPALGGAWAVQYADDDPSRRLSETRTDEATARRLPEDGMAGSVYVEKRLDRCLADSEGSGAAV